MPSDRTQTPRAIGLLLALLCACNTTEVVGTIPAGADLRDPSGSVDAFSGDAAGSVDYCAGSGPPILRSPGATDGGVGEKACTGRLAQVAFRYGLCTCAAFNAGAAVTVDSYDSQQMMSPRSLGGSVGVNGNLSTSSAVDISGSLWVGDPNGLNFTSVKIGQELRSAGSAVGSGSLTVGGDAFVNGDANTGGALSVGGVLTAPVGRLVAGNPGPQRVQRAPVSVAPPCDCSAANLIDVAGYVKAYSTQNDNQALPLDPERLHNFNGDVSLSLPCGRYYLTRVNGTGKLTLQINGRVALFVGENIEFSQDLTINLGPAGQLDLFVGGTLLGSAALRLGSPETAARLRVYVASTSSIALSGAVTLSGNLYAPLASLNVGGALTVNGALFVKNLATPAPVVIHHDAAIFRAGDACPAPPAACKTCRDCGNQACQNGACGSCTDDSGCCAPLQCKNGQCVYILG